MMNVSVRIQRSRRINVWATKEGNVRGDDHGIGEQANPLGLVKNETIVANLKPSVSYNVAIVEIKSTTPLSVRFWNLVHIPLSPVPFLSQSHYHLPSPRDLVPIPNSVSIYQNIFSDLDLRSLCFYLPESNVLKKIKYFFTKVGCFFDRQL